MAEGMFVRLNASMLLNSGMGDGQLISVIGTMEATDGETLTFRASDGITLEYKISPGFEFVQVSYVI